MDSVGGPPLIDLGASPDGTGPVLLFSEGDAAAEIAPAASFSAPDGWNSEGWTLSVSFEEEGSPDDMLTVLGKDGLQAEAGEIRYAAILIGTYAGGARGSELAIVFNELATAEAVQTLLRAIAFSNASEDPATTARNVKFALVQGETAVSATATVTVAPTNDPPAVDLNAELGGTVSVLEFTEGDAETAIAPAALVVDVDSRDFDGGTLTVSFAAGGSADDALAILDSGGISVAAGEVSYGGAVIGSVAGGDGGAHLVVALTAAASPEAVQALVRAVAFSNASDDPSAAPRTVTFALSDGDGGSTTSSATVEFATDGIVHVPVVADGTDQAAIINSVLATSNASVVVLPAGEFMIGTNIVVPEGKTLIGAGRDGTVLKVLPTFDFRLGTSALEVSGTLANLTVDVAKANLGAGGALRVNGVTGRGDGFLVEQVASKNATGYAFWACGPDASAPASGTFRDCYAENANVLFETTYADGVLFENCIGADGDGDIWCEGAFHPATGSSNITFKDSSYNGRAIIANVLADDSHQQNIVFENVHGVTIGQIGVFADGWFDFTNEIYFINSSFKAHSNGANLADSRVFGTGTRFESYGIGFAITSGSAEMVDSVAIGIAHPQSLSATFGVYAEAPVSWEGGTIGASGVPGSTAAIGHITLNSTALLRGENVSVSEAAPERIDVHANDSNPRAPSPIATIAGKPVARGQSVALESGAKVTLQDDGILTYDPAGAYALAAVGSGAVNTAALDQFSYVLEDGFTGQVRVTVNGTSSAGDVLRGDAGANTIAGSGLRELFMLDQGGDDTVFGNGGNDTFYFGGTFSAGDVVQDSEGTDAIILQGDYSAGIAFGSGEASNIRGIESISLAPGDFTDWGDSAGNSYSYDLTMIEGNAAAGAYLKVNGFYLRPGEDLTFDASAVVDGKFIVLAGQGVDRLTGGAGNDIFVFGHEGRFGPSDVVAAGGGYDTVYLRGDYSLDFTASGAGSMTGVESIFLGSATDGQYATGGDGEFDYRVVWHDAMLTAGAIITVNGSSLGTSESMAFDGSDEESGRFRLFGGASGDTLIGGGGGDFIHGGGGGDLLRGNGGGDAFRFYDVSESAPGAGRFDSILDFRSGLDAIDLGVIDAKTATPGDQAFTFIGSSAFAGSGGSAGQLRAERIDAATNTWKVEGDVDGDGVADLLIHVVVEAGQPLTATSFFL